MMCDLLIAADTAKFGQPEIKLGVLPGMGGSQRLTRAIGKAKAMDLILTGRTIDAAEAERSGLVSRVVPADDLLTEAKAVATTISQMSRSAARMAKEAVNRAFESTLSEGLLYERRLFHSTFATDDQSEGMAAFIEKRPAELHPPVGAAMSERGAAATTPVPGNRRPKRNSSRPRGKPRHRPGRRPRAAAGRRALVGSPLHLHRHRGRPGFHLVFDDAVAVAAGPLFQGLVSGISGAIGYGIGVFAVWLVRYMRAQDSSPPAPRGRGWC